MYMINEIGKDPKRTYTLKGKMFFILSFAIFSVQLVCAQSNDDTLSLAGTWHFRIDTADQGIQQKFFDNHLPETIHLPGSMVQNNKGFPVTINTQWTASIRDSSWYFDPVMAKYRQPDSLKFPFFLTPKKRYVNPAWYQKEVIIP